MSVKIKKKLKVLDLIHRSKEEFREEIKKDVVPEIIKTIEGGNNPVKGGKQAKYSDSYLEKITGKRKTTSNGKTTYVKINTKDTTTGANSSLKYGKNGSSKKSNASSSLESRYGKRKSPVNLKLTNDMLKSAKTEWTEKGVRVYFTDEKAEWHDNGVPENNLPARRLLPSKSGEEFNRNIFNRIMEAIKKALKKNL